MPTPSLPALAQLSAVSADEIARVAAAGPALVLVSAPAQIATAEAIEAGVGQRFDGHEVVLNYPDGVRWKVDEIQARVIDASRFAATEHRHLVLGDAHAATQAVHDRLLKVLEEQSTNTTVWLTYPDYAVLPATLRGRAADQLRLAAGPADAFLDLLRAVGATDEDAKRMLVQAGDDLTVAHAAARYGLTDQLARYAHGYRTATPTLTAGEVLLAGAHLAVAAHHRVSRPPAAPAQPKGSLPVADLARLSPQARATLRKLTAARVRRWKSEVVDDFAAADRRTARQLGLRLEGLASTEDALTFNTPLMTVLATVLATLNS